MEKRKVEKGRKRKLMRNTLRNLRIDVIDYILIISLFNSKITKKSFQKAYNK